MKNVGLFSKNVGDFLKNVGLFPKNVGDFLKNVGLFPKNVGDFLNYLRRFLCFVHCFFSFSLLSGKLPNGRKIHPEAL